MKMTANNAAGEEMMRARECISRQQAGRRHDRHHVRDSPSEDHVQSCTSEKKQCQRKVNGSAERIALVADNKDGRSRRLIRVNTITLFRKSKTRRRTTRAARQ